MSERKKRGPYKKYLEHGSDYSVPKRTRTYWNAKNRQRNLDNSGVAVHIDDLNQNDVAEQVEPSLNCNAGTNVYNADDSDSSVSIDENVCPEESACDNPLPNVILEDEENFVDEGYYNYCDSSEEQTDSDQSEDDCGDAEEPIIDRRNMEPGYVPDYQENHHEEDNDVRTTECLDKDKNDVKYPKQVLLRTLLVLAAKLRKNLDNETITLVTKLIDAVIDVPINFTSTYHFKKIINQHTMPLEIHHFCPNCRIYIGKESQIVNDDIVEGIDDDEQVIHCRECNVDINVKNNRRLGHIFLYLPLTPQLQDFCERHHEDLSYVKNRKKQCLYAIEDIFDGVLYKNHFSNDSSEDMISINFSIDGTPLFKSSVTSITPILCTINELHPQQRKHHIFLTSVFLGSTKPIMNEYIKPFVEECKLLFDEGFDYNYDGIMYRKKCQVLLGICDSVERPELRGSKTFRGQYGCGFCKHPGEEIEKGNGHARIYPINDNGNAYGEGLRCHTETLEHINNFEKGMKYRSALCDVPNFDIIDNLVPDWMHCVALGVCRQFLKLWFDTSYHQKEYYLGNHLKSIDEMLLFFKPSMDISRTPRKMSKDRLHLKAHELVIWLLFYSLPILRLFLPSKFVQHWSLLVEGVSILLKTSIMECDVYNAQRNLFKFVIEVEELYGKEHLSFNVHLLTHLPQNVLKWGPLWTHSAFCYENFHQFLKKLVKSSNSADLQILDAFRSQIALFKLQDLYEDLLTFRQHKLLHELTEKKKFLRY